MADNGTFENLIEKYSDVRNGQDLINKGVVPKPSSTYLALIAQERLKELAAIHSSQVSDEMLGAWVPAFQYQSVDAGTGKEGTTLYSAASTGKDLEGMVVRGSPKIGGVEMPEIKGVVVENNKGENRVVIKWDTGQIDQVTFPSFKSSSYDALSPIKLTGKTIKPILNPDVVADERSGHYVRFREDFEGSARVEGTLNKNYKVSAGKIGKLVGYDPKTSEVMLKIDKNNVKFTAPYLATVLEASSIGQILPKDRELEIMNQALSDFFPHTRLDPMIAENVIVAMFTGADIIFFGPPGSGKTSLSDDIREMAELQEIIFTVEGCRSNCNPYSIFDKEYSKVVKPCPECMIKYGEKDPKTKLGFRETGIFRHPSPGKVPVVVSAYTLAGKAIEFLQGSEKLQRMHLAGYKLPSLDGSDMTRDESDPEGFHPGALVRTNNGMLVISELGNIRNATLDDFLDALTGFFIKPDELRFNYPTNNIILGTTNSVEKLKDTLVDRMRLVDVPYPSDIETSHEIIDRAFYNNTVSLRDVPISDSHIQHPDGVKHMIMPEVVEMGVIALYQEFRSSYKQMGLPDIAAGNRSILDALSAARAKLLLDSIFYENAPGVVDENYALFGIKYAMETRLQVDNHIKREEMKTNLNTWLEQKFPPIMMDETNKWWCEFQGKMADRAAQDASTEANLLAEFKLYETNVDTAVKTREEVKAAHETGRGTAELQYPMMDFLFDNQPDFGKMGNSQLKALMRYLLDSKKKSAVASR